MVVIWDLEFHSYVLGWRIGWAIAPASAASAIRNIHVKITDSAPAPFQEAALAALRSPTEYFEMLRRVGSGRWFFTCSFKVDRKLWIPYSLNAVKMRYHEFFAVIHCSLFFSVV